MAHRQFGQYGYNPNEYDSDSLPQGWEMLIDKQTGWPFFVDHNTQQTTWQDPRKSKSHSMPGQPSMQIPRVREIPVMHESSGRNTPPRTAADQGMYRTATPPRTESPNNREREVPIRQIPIQHEARGSPQQRGQNFASHMRPEGRNSPGYQSSSPGRHQWPHHSFPSSFGSMFNEPSWVRDFQEPSWTRDFPEPAWTRDIPIARDTVDARVSPQMGHQGDHFQSPPRQMPPSTPPFPQETPTNQSHNQPAPPPQHETPPSYQNQKQPEKQPPQQPISQPLPQQQPPPPQYQPSQHQYQPPQKQYQPPQQQQQYQPSQQQYHPPEHQYQPQQQQYQPPQQQYQPPPPPQEQQQYQPPQQTYIPSDQEQRQQGPSPAVNVQPDTPPIPTEQAQKELHPPIPAPAPPAAPLHTAVDHLKAEEGKAHERSPSPAPPNVGPLEHIGMITQEAERLNEQVDAYNGPKGAKPYLYIEEMLTRLLIKLDRIESNGQDEIRMARKQGVRLVQGSLDKLERKGKEYKASMANQKNGQAPSNSNNNNGSSSRPNDAHVSEMVLDSEVNC